MSRAADVLELSADVEAAEGVHGKRRDLSVGLRVPVGIQAAVGSEAREIAPRHAVHRGEAAADDHAAVGLHRDGLDVAVAQQIQIRPGQGRIRRGLSGGHREQADADLEDPAPDGDRLSAVEPLGHALPPFRVRCCTGGF